MSGLPDDPIHIFDLVLEKIVKVREAGQGLKVLIKSGDTVLHGEVFPQPVTGGSSSYRRREQKANLEKAKTVVAEYPDLLDAPEDAGGYYFINTKKRLDDKFDDINGKLRAAGFRYVRWEKDQKHTGGWKGDK